MVLILLFIDIAASLTAHELPFILCQRNQHIVCLNSFLIIVYNIVFVLISFDVTHLPGVHTHFVTNGRLSV